MTAHPIQPAVMDGNVVRFKENAIVRYLLDKGGIDLNHLAIQQDFSRDDWVQFNQLIGYSVSGWGGLSCVTKEDYAAAMLVHSGASQTQARIDALEGTLREARQSMRDGVVALYGIHPDDLCADEDSTTDPTDGAT